MNSLPKSAVGGLGGEVGQRVAGDLDRDQDEGDDPEFVPHQLDAAPEGGADAAVLDLDHRGRQPEPDEDEDAGEEEEDEPDGDAEAVEQVDRDQRAVLDHPGDFAQGRRLSVVGVGEQDRTAPV